MNGGLGGFIARFRGFLQTSEKPEGGKSFDELEREAKKLFKGEDRKRRLEIVKLGRLQSAGRISERNRKRLTHLRTEFLFNHLREGNPNAVRLPEDEAELLDYIDKVELLGPPEANQYLREFYLRIRKEEIPFEQARKIIEHYIRMELPELFLKKGGRKSIKAPNDLTSYWLEVSEYQAKYPEALKKRVAQERRATVMRTQWDRQAYQLAKSKVVGLSESLAKELYGEATQTTKSRVRKKLERFRKQGFM